MTKLQYNNIVVIFMERAAVKFEGYDRHLLDTSLALLKGVDTTLLTCYVDIMIVLTHDQKHPISILQSSIHHT